MDATPTTIDTMPIDLLAAMYADVVHAEELMRGYGWLAKAERFRKTVEWYEAWVKTLQ